MFDLSGYVFCLLSCACQAAYLLLVEFKLAAQGITEVWHGRLSVIKNRVPDAAGLENGFVG
eukprot:scaffold136068_cov17-Tisochrysis_lutea.AAC.1